MKMMQIKNLSTRQIIALDVKVLESLRDQTLGMLSYKSPKPLLLRTRYGIHTFFMKYPIDILVINQQNQVVAMKKHMKPNTLFLWNPRYNLIVELPAHTIQQTATTIGDRIAIEKKR